MATVAENHCPAALPQALQIEKKHKKVLTLFHECHQVYDKKYVTDEEIDLLGTYTFAYLTLRTFTFLFREEDCRVHGGL